MRLLRVLAISAVALASCASADSIRECNASEQRTVSDLLASGNAQQLQCTKVTSWTPTLSPLPTGRELAMVCMNPNCLSLISAIERNIATDCVYDGTAMRSQWVDPLKASCSKMSASAPTTARPPAPQPTSSPSTSQPEVTKSALTPTPSKSNSSTGSSSGPVSNSVEAPSPVSLATASPVVSSTPSPPAKSSGQAQSGTSAQTIAISALFVAIAMTNN